MDTEAARRVIADYLVGARVPQASLDAACRAVSEAGPGYVRGLRESVGLEDGETSPCALFRARLAEFCGLGRDERGVRMPELVEHMEVCRHCCRLFWSRTRAWIAEPAAGRAGAGPVRGLAMPIGLAVGEAGRVRESGGGPLAAGREWVAAVAGEGGATAAPPGPETAPAHEEASREWCIEDPETGYALRLLVKGLSPGKAQVSILLARMTGEAVDAKHVRIEVRDQAGLLHAAGRLADFQARPLGLAEGAWEVTLSAPRPLPAMGSRQLVWHLPIRISTEKPNEQEQEEPS